MLSTLCTTTRMHRTHDLLCKNCYTDRPLLVTVFDSSPATWVALAQASKEASVIRIPGKRLLQSPALVLQCADCIAACRWGVPDLVLALAIAIARRNDHDLAHQTGTGKHLVIL